MLLPSKQAYNTLILDVCEVIIGHQGSVNPDAGNNAPSAQYKNSGELLLHAAMQSILSATMGHVGLSIQNYSCTLQGRYCDITGYK